jgi:hypothetical protein
MRTCGPLTFGDIGTPFLPVLGSLAILLEAPLLLGEVFVTVEDDHGGPGTSIGWRQEYQFGRAVRRRQHLEKKGKGGMQEDALREKRLFMSSGALVR